MFGVTYCDPRALDHTQETADTLRDGWLHSGDVAVKDADGFITIVDRMKDMIITGGRNVYSVEVEQALSGHPDVADVAIVGHSPTRCSAK